MSFPEFLEWLTFLRMEQGEEKPKDSWGGFKAAMMAQVQRQRGKR